MLLLFLNILNVYLSETSLSFIAGQTWHVCLNGSANVGKNAENGDVCRWHLDGWWSVLSKQMSSGLVMINVSTEKCRRFWVCQLVHRIMSRDENKRKLFNIRLFARSFFVTKSECHLPILRNTSSTNLAILTSHQTQDLCDVTRKILRRSYANVFFGEKSGFEQKVPRIPSERKPLSFVAEAMMKSLRPVAQSTKILKHPGT